MKLYDFTLPEAESGCVRLYYHSEPRLTPDNGALRVPKYGIVSFDTYFNCFSYSKFKKYTLVEDVSVRLSLQGDFEIRLIYQKVEDQTKTLIKSVNFSSPERSDSILNHSLDTLGGEGFLYIELLSQSDKSVFFGGEYATDMPIVNDIKIALAFCTYRREHYLFANIKSINAYLDNNSDIKDFFKIIAIDNGNTIALSSAVGFELFPNRNFGGSGGFTRGIIEALKKDVTHFLLMDDDIRLDPSILRKTLSFLRYAKSIERFAVGGAMLELDNPYIQYEMGGLTSGLRLRSMKNKVDLSLPESVLANEKEEYFNYNAWWYICMPVSAAEKGLPLPLFIKCDDIEYGLRFDGEIMVVNGIGVWHESFVNKHSAELEYYVIRNETILTALYFPKVTVFDLFKKLMRAIGFRLVFYRYYEVELIFKAVSDFLKGPEFLMSLDAEALHKALREKTPKYLDDNQLREFENVEFDEEKAANAAYQKGSYLLQLMTLNGYLIPKVFYSKTDKESYRVVDVNKKKPCNFFKAIRVLQYNKELKKGFVTTLNKGKLISSGIRLIAVFCKLLFKYRKTAKAYKEAMPRLTSYENWSKLLYLAPEIEEFRSRR